MKTIFFLESKPRTVSGYTLLEVMMAIGLCAILALVSVPTMTGWLSEHRIRLNAGKLIEAVQKAKIQAQLSGTPGVIAILSEKEKLPLLTNAGVFYFKESDGCVWTVWKLGSKKLMREIFVDERGQLTPVHCELRQGEKFVRYRFDFLTGHAVEEASSF